jgi:FixJ family two-component response regulator
LGKRRCHNRRWQSGTGGKYFGINQSKLKKIKKIDSNAVIIMVPAMGHENFVKEAVLSGAVYFLVKPIKEENLIEVLSKIIEYEGT